MMMKSESHYSPQVMFIGLPQWGQTITPHFGCSNSSDMGTPKAEEISFSLSNVGFPDKDLDKAPSLTPIFFAVKNNLLNIN